MRYTTTNYLLLILVVTFSFLSVCTFDFYPSEPYDKSLDIFRLITPGIFFSLYIVILQRQNWQLKKLMIFFCLLLVLYYAVLIAGLSSWGVGVPFAGAIGALVIKKLFYQKIELLDLNGTKYLLLGFITGLIGLCLYYLVKDTWTDGVGFGLIIIIWQLGFGILWIKQTDSPEHFKKSN